MNTESVRLLQDLAAILSYQQSAGIDVYPLTEDVRNFLRLDVQRSEGRAEGLSRVRMPDGGNVAPPEPQAREVAPPKAAKADPGALSDIAREVEDCRACPLIASRIVPTIGQGEAKARLMVVGDWLAVPLERDPSAGALFGIEQDRMLERMMGAIGMGPGEVFVTNVIKCAIPENTQPQAEHVRTCFSYLRRQIKAINPLAILAMGMIATRTLLERSESLSRLRGVLHSYTTDDNRRIPLIATYHPSFLLQHPEMKKATWIDLQLLARQLGNTPV